eukprot:15454296-Alexandrium_andersonii.AAC.1
MEACLLWGAIGSAETPLSAAAAYWGSGGEQGAHGARMRPRRSPGQMPASWAPTEATVASAPPSSSPAACAASPPSFASL